MFESSCAPRTEKGDRKRILKTLLFFIFMFPDSMSKGGNLTFITFINVHAYFIFIVLVPTIATFIVYFLKIFLLL